jgi:predicted membrane chloride channel (bestrophin family)
MSWTLPFVIVFIAYTLWLSTIADELEDLFGIQPNDLALDAMSAMIENTCLRFIINILSLLKNLNTTTSLRFYRRKIAVRFIYKQPKI